eukprot:TRINITY_DN29304_c0_g1_i1.p1 TRINITY_DN29304_c0_g1~~TRINITY_DN29304_c0_g1_i1.p1  ORF type:complete len:196 (+),score=32.27 TRINITY_DN29304_c0_g1_i1:124-711(+)
MIRGPPRSTLSSSSAASDVYKRQVTCGSDAADMGATMCCTERTAEETPQDPPQDLNPDEHERQSEFSKEGRSAPTPTDVTETGWFKGVPTETLEEEPPALEILATPILEIVNTTAKTEDSVTVVPLRSHKTSVLCSYCGEEPTKESKTSGKCSVCEVAYYCCSEHQKADWEVHQHECSRLKTGERAKEKKGLCCR